jgi:hypothetical protein
VPSLTGRHFLLALKTSEVSITAIAAGHAVQRALHGQDRTGVPGIGS